MRIFPGRRTADSEAHGSQKKLLALFSRVLPAEVDNILKFKTTKTMFFFSTYWFDKMFVGAPFVVQTWKNVLNHERGSCL